MNLARPTRRLSQVAPAIAVAAAILGAAESASAQSRFLFSIDWHGPTVGMPAPSGVPIVEGDILTPTTSTSTPAPGPLPAPSIAIPHTALGLPGGCVGHPGGTPCIVEVDAFSMGNDQRFQPNFPLRPGQILFSVDEFGAGSGINPYISLDTEFPVGDSSADTFGNQVPLPPVPLPPGFGIHTAISDGDGAPSGSGAFYPCVGTIEGNPPAPGVPDAGDNLDALDVFEPISTGGGVPYFSLDSGIFDPLEGVPGSGSAVANGFVGGDVLTVGPVGLPIVYAPAAALGLDLFGGDLDDVDALILRENGIGGYQVSNQPYDWMGGGTDMLVYSVRRGSAIIGAPDSIFGIPIEEGDLLVPPVFGGVSPFPGILIAAETLGLATMRSGTAPIGADLNAADSLRQPLLDCDGDGVEDAIAIASGLVADADGDGIPDSCAPPVMGPIGSAACICTAIVAPCGNSFPGGCINASGTGAVLTGFGTLSGPDASFAADDLILSMTGLPGPTFGLTVYGSFLNPPSVLGNGILCAGGNLFRLPFIYPIPASGNVSIGPGLIGLSAGNITIGSTWHFQSWFRDIPGPCGSFSNTTNALTVTFN